MTHPRKDEYGKTVTIDHPHAPSLLDAWSDPWVVATVVPDGPMPQEVNGVSVSLPWLLPPDRVEWQRLAKGMIFEEPPFDPKGMKPAAGAVVVEPDGRLWLVSPTNRFGQYTNTFPKGKAQHLDLKATALKEVFEEAGLLVDLFDHLIDVTKTTSRTRYYLARRRGGNPADMCSETQAVHLVPLEVAKGMLNQNVDHEVVDRLHELRDTWAGWFFHRDDEDPSWEDARSGRMAASRHDWSNLPLPLNHTRITLDVRLSKEESENLKLGFVPRMMEQKWFVYFEGSTLYEHRSWTGFCRSQIHFVADGDGLRAIYADVNREERQYQCRDDAQDRADIEGHIWYLAHLTPEDRNAEDPFVAGLKQSLVPNYLGSPEVVQGLLEPLFQAVLDHQVALATGKSARATYEACGEQNTRVARIIAGEDSAFTPIGTWNSAAQLGALVVKVLDLDQAYYADENLFCILTEGLGRVELKLKEIFAAYQSDPARDLHRDLLPRFSELLHFTASVLMGTQSVLFPDRTLKDFHYLPPQTLPLPPPPPPEPCPSLVKQGRPIALPDPIGALANEMGGVYVLAEHLGISPRSLRRWAHIGPPTALARKSLQTLCLEHGVDATPLTPGPSQE
jgi:8-oxo-dGTP pyrophosphatase MutT (NUDIX family)